MSDPVFSNGYVYAMLGPDLAKINESTGAVVWRTAFEAHDNSLIWGVAVSNGTVVVNGSSCYSQSDAGQRMAAFRATDGALVWSVQAGESRTMVVSHGYVATQGGSVGGTALQVYSLSTGALVWSRSYDGCYPDDTILVAGGRLVHVSCDPTTGAARLEASALATGARAWSRPGDWRLQRADSATWTGHHLFASNSSGEYDINPQDGSIGPALNNGPVLAVGPARYFAACGSSVCAYSLTTHTRAWSTDIQDFSSPSVAALANSVLYLDNGVLLNSITGARLGLLGSLDGLGATQLVVGDGHVGAVSDLRVLDVYGLPG